MLSGFEIVSGLADGASVMPAKWHKRVFSFRFYEGRISCPPLHISSWAAPQITSSRHCRSMAQPKRAASASCGAEQPTGSLPREQEIAAISTLVFDPCRSRCPSDLSKSAQVQLPKNAEISGDYKFRTKTAKYTALEKKARRERISGLSASLTVQRFAD